MYKLERKKTQTFNSWKHGIDFDKMLYRKHFRPYLYRQCPIMRYIRVPWWVEYFSFIFWTILFTRPGKYTSGVLLIISGQWCVRYLHAVPFVEHIHFIRFVISTLLWRMQLAKAISQVFIGEKRKTPNIRKNETNSINIFYKRRFEWKNWRALLIHIYSLIKHVFKLYERTFRITYLYLNVINMKNTLYQWIIVS